MPRPVFAAILLLASPGLLLAETAAGQPQPGAITSPGKVTAVTVYQGQALVTREVDLAGAAGLAEVVVTGLPARVTPGSLYAEPVGDVEVRSVRYRTRPVAEDTRQEVRELDEQIQAVEDQLAEVAARTRLLGTRENYLQRLEGFVAVTAGRELSAGVLDAATLKELTKTIFDGRAEVARERLEIDRAGRGFKQQLAVLTAQRKKLASASSRTLREAVVFVRVPPGAGAGKLRVTYLVSGATWSPSYNLRATDDRDRLTVEYNASVTQQSGEDWSGVAMTLSTASPSLVASSPTLLPLPVRLASAPKRPASNAAPQGNLSDLRQQQKAIAAGRRNANIAAAPNAFSGLDLFGRGEAELAQQLPSYEADGESLFRGDSGRAGGRGGSGGMGGGGFGAAYANASDPLRRSDFSLNSVGNQIQLFECSSLPVEPTTRAAKPRAGEGISVMYRLASATSLPSRADEQLIPIASLELTGDFYRVARPVLTEYVYEEARVVNDSEIVLLAGPAATFLGDRFVGRGTVPTVATGEPFTVGLGIDESLRAGRELVNKTRSVQGANRVVRLDYELTVQNFGATPAEVRLFDRMPSANDAEIKVTLVASAPPADNAGAGDQADPATTADARERKQGILRWMAPVPAKADAAGRTVVTYTLQLEYDKNRELALAPGKP
ncbi:MAG: mucoidy inhibitor MuiA family protein [Planctomycetota bacterium]